MQLCRSPCSTCCLSPPFPRTSSPALPQYCLSQACRVLGLANVVSSCLFVTPACPIWPSPHRLPLLPQCPSAPVNLHILTLPTLATLLESGSNRTVTRESILARKTNHTVKTTRAVTVRRRRVLGSLSTTKSTRPTRLPLSTTGPSHDPDRSLAPPRPFASRTGSIHTTRRPPNPTVWIPQKNTRPPLADGVEDMPRSPAAATTGAAEATHPATPRATPGAT